MRAIRTAIVTMAALALLAGCGSSNSGTAVPASGGPATTTATSAPPPISRTAPASAECSYKATPDHPAPSGKDVGLPPNSGSPAASVVLKTNTGDIPITLAGATAPCTVRSFAHLAGKKYFDGTPCHRITAHETLKVLQCGDPTGTGTGGPGYTVPDENPTDLPAAGNDTSLYARGTVAMANTGRPDSGGSQFFIVYGDSTLPPKYAVFGKIDAAGLATLDKIAAAGLTPGDRGPDDGTPKNPVTIQQAVVGS